MCVYVLVNACACVLCVCESAGVCERDNVVTLKESLYVHCEIEKIVKSCVCACV
jgi:hypothetical protein